MGSEEEDQAGCTQTRKVIEVTWEGLRVVVVVVVMASLHCQVGWTWRHLGNASLSISMRLFPEKYN